jgi:hypothetical protein
LTATVPTAITDYADRNCVRASGPVEQFAQLFTALSQQLIYQP